MVNEFPFGTSQSGKRDYLLRVSVCPENFPMGRTKKTFTIYIPTGIPGICGNWWTTCINGNQIRWTTRFTLKSAGEKNDVFLEIKSLSCTGFFYKKTHRNSKSSVYGGETRSPTKHPLPVRCCPRRLTRINFNWWSREFSHVSRSTFLILNFPNCSNMKNKLAEINELQ